ncbi:MAG: dienelactone hydrolase family protein [Anaerolineae bacterium]
MDTTKLLARIGLGLAALVALLVIGLVAAITIDAAAGPTAAEFTNVTFPAADGPPIGGYLAEPEGPGPHPAVLMVHEWWGMNAEITELADIMAEAGYVVLAPDTYRGAQTGLVPRALYLRLTVDTERVDSDMNAAYGYLVAQPDVDPDRIGVLGFCYGGGVALRHGINSPDIEAVANLYGDTVSDPQAFGALLAGDTPVFGVFGDADMNIPVEEARAFEDALAAAGIPHAVTIYADMPHAFIQPHNIDEPGTPREAWQDVLAFFGESLAP